MVRCVTQAGYEVAPEGIIFSQGLKTDALTNAKIEIQLRTKSWKYLIGLCLLASTQMKEKK